MIVFGLWCLYLPAVFLWIAPIPSVFPILISMGEWHLLSLTRRRSTAHAEKVGFIGKLSTFASTNLSVDVKDMPVVEEIIICMWVKSCLCSNAPLKVTMSWWKGFELWLSQEKKSAYSVFLKNHVCVAVKKSYAQKKCHTLSNIKVNYIINLKILLIITFLFPWNLVQEAEREIGKGFGGILVANVHYEFLHNVRCENTMETISLPPFRTMVNHS